MSTSPLSAVAPTGGISLDTSRLGTDANLKKAGERFEAVFTGMMLGSMRKAKLAEGLFESKAADQFRDMWDQKLAENMAVTAPMGIGKAMTDFLAKGMAATALASSQAAKLPAPAAVSGAEGAAGTGLDSET